MGANSDNFGFGGGEQRESLADDITGGEMFRKPRVGGVVTRFAFEQAGIKFSQFGIGHMVAEQAEAFAGAGFNQARDNQPVDRPFGF
jgi:hypothetical protein